MTKKKIFSAFAQFGPIMRPTWIMTPITHALKFKKLKMNLMRLSSWLNLLGNIPSKILAVKIKCFWTECLHAVAIS